LCRLLLGTDGAIAGGRRDERAWIVLLALLILLEKVAPFGRQIALLAGVVLIAAGMWLFSMGMS
jgi:predicted metal-binding membrane protein